MQKLPNSLPENAPDVWPQLVATLSIASGANPEFCVAYAASVLGGVAGPVGSIRGYLGEIHAGGLSLIATGKERPLRSLENLMLEPALLEQDRARLRSRSTHPLALRDLETGYLGKELRRETLERFEKRGRCETSPEVDSLHHIAGSRRQLQLIRQPSLILTAPDVPKSSDALADCLDHHALVYDPAGAMITDVLGGGRGGRDAESSVERVARQQGAGSDHMAAQHPGDGPGCLARVRTPYLARLEEDHLGRALNHPVTGQLLGSCLIVSPNPSRSKTSEYAAVRHRIGEIQTLVTALMHTRWRGNDLSFAVEVDDPQCIGLTESYDSRLDALPPSARPFSEGLYGLPERLMWTLHLTENNRSRSVSPLTQRLALHTALWCADRHQSLIVAALEQDRVRLRQMAMEEMLRKLQVLGPCGFRDLVRTYSDQKKATHEPTLRLLERAGCVRTAPCNRLELIPGTKVPDTAALVKLIDEYDRGSFSNALCN